MAIIIGQLARSLGQSRQTLNQAAELWFWGLLFLAWGLRSWVAILVGLAWSWLAYGLAINAAFVYADLVETAFDTQRWEIYKALHFKLPVGTANEIASGKEVTKYLWRGITTHRILILSILKYRVGKVFWNRQRIK